MNEKRFPAPQALIDKQNANKAAYLEAVSSLKIAPLWTLREVLEEPAMGAFVGDCMARLPKEREWIRSTINGDYSVTLEWK